jgi:hypothetical protein
MTRDVNRDFGESACSYEDARNYGIYDGWTSGEFAGVSEAGVRYESGR